MKRAQEDLEPLQEKNLLSETKNLHLAIRQAIP